ncbi:peptidoglycan-binding protein [Actinokineospora sp. HUAS TT18]|uniref:peptidoglycan-binding domain-containing protein n=1 Tax=Actinokineospora sp. HUAS TT18 TaxID=3447451 RepID=UPI003F527BBB
MRTKAYFRAPIIGLLTAAALFGGMTTGAATAAADTCTASHKFAGTLQQVRPGQHGTYVLGLQLALAREGYGLTGTGFYGPNTKAAVTDFQAKHGIKASGIVGAKTWQALVGVLPACATNPMPGPKSQILPGDRGDKVWWLRDALEMIYGYDAVQSLDYWTYDAKTQALVKRFQRATGIKDSGIVGPKTWQALHLVASMKGIWRCGC